MNDDQTPTPPEPRWQPLSSIDRRVAGVLAEKAKTTPDTYPMSLNAVCAGCNQKSNRSPAMKLEPEDIEESLERLREMGAVGMIQGHGRVTKYRHYLYDWLAVGKVELAIMAELLLRGAQSQGELRGRAARMEPIPDLGTLRPLLAELKARGLVVPLTPEGRGHVLTHALYKPREMENLRAQYGPVGSDATSSTTPPSAAPLSSGPSRDESDYRAPSPTPAAPPMVPASPVPSPAPFDSEVVDALRREIGELRAQVVQLRSDLDDLSVQQDQSDNEVRSLRDSLGG